MTEPLRRYRWLRRLALAAACGGSVYLVLGVLIPWQQRAWITAAGRHLEEQQDEACDAAARALLAQGTAALPELAHAIGSERAAVALAAQAVLLEEFEHLEAQQDASSASALALLAASLAAEMEHYGPSTRQLAAAWAERMLRNDVAPPSNVERDKLIADCGSILRIASRDGEIASGRSKSDIHWQATPRPQPWEGLAALIASGRQPGITTANEILPGGGIEPPGVEVPSLPQTLAKNEPTEPEPRPLPAVSGELGHESYERPEKFRKPLHVRRIPRSEQSPASEVPARGSHTSQEPTPGGISEIESEARRVLPEVRSKSGNGPPRDETMIRLLQQLTLADEQAANRAATALAERGLPKEHLELARRLGDPDPEVRRSLVEILPRITGLDARPWLLWLAHDEHADVRLSALSMLATTNDARLLQQIEEIARADHDERIAALAERLSQRRR